MKQFVKWLFLVLPAFLWLLSAGSCAHKQYRVNQRLTNAERIVWGNGESLRTVRVDTARTGELSRHTIRIMTPGGTVDQQAELVVDADMFGGGFVRAMNADADPEMEILAWGAHEEKQAFFLDYTEDGVRSHPFSEASHAAKTLARQWHEAHVSSQYSALLLLFPLLGYYILVGVVRGAVCLFRRRDAN